MGRMIRRDIISYPIQQGTVLMGNILRAHDSGYPILNVFLNAGIEFEELFGYDNLFVYHDVAREGVEQITLHNYHGSFAFVRPNGIVMITYRNNDAIQRYEGGGIIAIVTKIGSKRQNRRLYINPNTLEPYYMNGGDCR